MYIDIQSYGIEINDDLRQHTVHRLRAAMHWASNDVKTVHVRFSNIQRVDGDQTKRCLIQIFLLNKPVVVSEDIESDVNAAVDKAVERIARVMRRKFGRSREADSHWFEHMGWNVKSARSGKVYREITPSSAQYNRLVESVN